MKTTITTKQGRFTINSEYTGSKKANWSNGTSNWNNHIVRVSHKGRYLTFDFWASIMNPAKLVACFPMASTVIIVYG